MKCKKFPSKAVFLCLALIGWAGAAQAETVEVSTQAQFANAYKLAANATEGTETTIVMAAGNYDGTDLDWTQLKFPVKHAVKLQAADGATVSLTIKVRKVDDEAAGSLIFDGIKIIPSDNYFMDLGGITSNVGDLIFRNCEITSGGSFNRSLIYGGTAANTINSIVIENCRIHDCGTGYVFIRPTHMVKSFSATGNTMYNYGGEGFFHPQTLYPGTSFVATFSNNTIYKWSKNGSYYLLNLSGYTKGQTDNSATITINDNIIWGMKETRTQDSRVLRYDATVGKVVMKNNLIYEWAVWYGERCEDKTVSNLTTADVDAALVEGGNFKVPPFANASEGDFTLDITNYPKLATCSSVGSLIGAPQHGKYTLTVGAAKAATLTLPFETTIPDGVKAYTLTYTSGDNATATPVETTLPAHTPVLVNAEAGSYAFSATGTVESVAGTPQHGAMTGAYILTDVPTGSYVLQNQGGNVGFYKVASGTPQKIKPFRAYLTAGSLAHMLNIDFGSETTVINKVRSSVPMVSGEYYTLHGQRVVHPTKGLYIVNGKKVLVK